MNRSLLKIEFAKLKVYFILLLIVAGYVLFNPKPLKSFDMIACMLGVIHGAVIGFLAYKDFGGVETFMFSRSFSRNCLFWYRWFLAFGLQIATLAIIASVIAIGLRSWINNESPYQPMIKWYELKILLSISFGMFAGLAVSVFFTLRSRIINAESPKNILKRIFRFLSYLAIPLILGIFFLIGNNFSNFDSPKLILTFAWLYVIATNAVAAFAGRQCFLKMEINS